MKNHKKLLIIVLALVIALAGLGVGLAKWSETLTITSTVNTGEVAVEIQEAFTDDDNIVNDVTKDELDDGTYGDPKASEPNAPRGDKNVGRSYAEVVDELTGRVTIDEGYPCYYTTAYFLIHNSGSIPVKIQGVWEHCNVDHWVSWDGGATWVRMPASTWYPVVPCTIKLIDFGYTDDTGVLRRDGVADLSVHITGIEFGKQLEYCETVLMDVDIHVEQGAAEKATYSFDEQVEFVQWNEYEPPTT